MTRTLASIPLVFALLLVGCEDGASTERKGFSVSLSTAILRMAPGETATLRTNIATTGGFIDDVTVSLDGTAPKGVAVEGATVRVEGRASPEVKFSVSGSTEPGVYDLGLVATADSLTDRVRVALVVTSDPAWTVDAVHSTVLAYRGGTSLAQLRLTPVNGFEGELSITLANAVEGVSVAEHTVDVQSASVLFTSIEVKVAGSVEPGEYPLELQVSGGGLTQTVALSVDVGAAPFDVALRPSLTVSPGRPSVLTFEVRWRGDFDEDLTFALSREPAAIRATPVTVPYEADQLATGMMLVQVGPDLALGELTVHLQGTSESAFASHSFGMSVVPFSGHWDERFGNSGVAQAAFGGGTVALKAMTVDADDRIVVAGNRTLTDGSFQLLVARFRADGTADTDFGVVGRYIESFPAPVSVEAVATDAQKRILLAGRQEVTGNVQAMVVRLTEAGLADQSFGSDGYVQVELGGTDVATDLLPEDSGHIVLTSIRVGPPAVGFVFRLDSDGTLDPTFGINGNGIAMVHPGEAHEIAAHPILGYLIAGAEVTAGQKFYVAWMNREGGLVENFGNSNNGRFLSDLGSTGMKIPFGLEVDAEAGTVLAGANRAEGAALIRLQVLSGLPDDTFGTNGVTMLDGFSARGLELDAAGRMLVAGNGGSSANGSFAVRRFLENGAADPEFGDFGVSDVVPVDGGVPSALALQADGRIIAAGSVMFSSTGTTGFGAIRLWP